MSGDPRNMWRMHGDYRSPLEGFYTHRCDGLFLGFPNIAGFGEVLIIM